ncbi:CaiB/BaiF CoA-transferase family protein [Streptomyces sp. NPDC049590]|uniref:CaiB/BaiF CoA transferase family protein n=1 Tax=Streptomyces sp. NPDC049590 TaxID=3154834 RepID=UPI00342C3A96
MLLSDLGANILRIDRPPGYDGGAPVEPRFNLLHRGRRSAALDLKNEAAVEAVLKLVRHADVVIEGFRPGVTEKLGVGPQECLAANPRLVYGRMTGWGQDGPLAHAPGHDVNYVSLTGVLHSVGRAGGPPVIPLNLAGDFGGGSLYLALGVVSALGAPWHDVCEAKDGRWLSVGSNEARFWRDTLRLLGLCEEDMPDQHDRTRWPELRTALAEVLRTRTRDEWCALSEGQEVCIAPVLSLGEAPGHPHLRARGTFVEVVGVVQPAPAPRFSRTPGAIQGPPAEPGQHTDEVLGEWGFTPDELSALRAARAII